MVNILVDALFAVFRINPVYAMAILLVIVELQVWNTPARTIERVGLARIQLASGILLNLQKIPACS